MPPLPSNPAGYTMQANPPLHPKTHALQLTTTRLELLLMLPRCCAHQAPCTNVYAHASSKEIVGGAGTERGQAEWGTPFLFILFRLSADNQQARSTSNSKSPIELMKAGALPAFPALRSLAQPPSAQPSRANPSAPTQREGHPAERHQQV